MFDRRWLLSLFFTLAVTVILAVSMREHVSAASLLSAGWTKAVWPPKLNQLYPDLELVDHTGRLVRMSDLKGKVIIVEYVGMTCPACQAFSGAHEMGGYGDVVPQKGLGAMKKYFPRYTGGLSLEDDAIVVVQMLLYSMSMEAPTPLEVRNWARHFGLDRMGNHVVLAGTDGLLGPASYNLIPGFQLIDKQFILRSDSTGHHPQQNLWTELLPMVNQLVQEHK